MIRKSLPLSRMLNHINQMTVVTRLMRIANIKLEIKNILMKMDGQPSEAEKESAIKSGILVPDSSMTHDEIVAEIKKLAERISFINLHRK